MKVRSPLTKWGLPPFLALVATLVYAAVDQGYENAKRASGQSNPTCPTNHGLTDVWGFFTCECTSYVAYRLNLNDVRHNGVLFKNSWTSGVTYSNAYNWNNAAATMGIREDQYPAVGSVAHWESVAGTGHVAYVQHLFTNPADGRLDAIGVMEYNWANAGQSPDHQYRYRKIGTGRGKGSKWPDSFLHFEEKGRDADNTNVTCVAGLDKSAYKPSGANAGTFCWKHASNSNATCSGASAHYYFDYRTCTKHTVSSSYCSGVTSSLPGYTAKIGSGFPRPIDPTVEKTDFAFCDGSTSSAQGTSNLVSGRTPKERTIFWRDITND